MKKSTNKNILASSRIRKDPTRDEFYTLPKTAEGLLKNIPDEFFFGKTVYCNCDGWESEIFKLLCARFSRYRLAKVYATKYYKDGNGTKIQYDGRKYVFEKMAGDGSFDSEESINILDESDVVVTNPPFSKLEPFIDLLFKREKLFIIIANLLQLISHKNIRKYLIGCRIAECGDKNSGNHVDFKRPNGDLAPAKWDGFTNIGHLTSVTRGSLAQEFRRPNGETASIRAERLSNVDFHVYLKSKTQNLTFEQLKAKKRVEYDDKTGILNVNLLQHIPVDYFDEMLLPVSVLIRPDVRVNFDILGVRSDVSVNGRRKFWRVLVKRKK